MWTQEVEFNEKGGFRDAFWVATSHEAEPDRTLTLGTLFPQAAPTSRRPPASGNLTAIRLISVAASQPYSIFSSA